MVVNKPFYIKKLVNGKIAGIFGLAFLALHNRNANIGREQHRNVIPPIANSQSISIFMVFSEIDQQFIFLIWVHSAADYRFELQKY